MLLRQKLRQLFFYSFCSNNLFSAYLPCESSFYHPFKKFYLLHVFIIRLYHQKVKENFYKTLILNIIYVYVTRFSYILRFTLHLFLTVHLIFISKQKTLITITSNKSFTIILKTTFIFLLEKFCLQKRCYLFRPVDFFHIHNRKFPIVISMVIQPNIQ